MFFPGSCRLYLPFPYTSLRCHRTVKTMDKYQTNANPLIRQLPVASQNNASQRGINPPQKRCKSPKPPGNSIFFNTLDFNFFIFSGLQDPLKYQAPQNKYFAPKTAFFPRVCSLSTAHSFSLPCPLFPCPLFPCPLSLVSCSLVPCPLSPVHCSLVPCSLVPCPLVPCALVPCALVPCAPFLPPML